MTHVRGDCPARVPNLGPGCEGAREESVGEICADEGRGFPRGVSAEADSDDSTRGIGARHHHIARVPRKEPVSVSLSPRVTGRPRGGRWPKCVADAWNRRVLWETGAPGRIRTCDPRLRRPPVYRGPTVAEVWGIGYQWRSYFVYRGLSTPPVCPSKKEGIGLRGATSAMTDPDVRRQRSHPTTRPHLVVATSVRVSD